MNLARNLSAAFAAAVVTVASTAAFAQDAPPPPVTDPENYRWAIYTSCTVVFAAIAVYLIVTHRRAAAISDEVAAIERRIDELEKGSG